MLNRRDFARALSMSALAPALLAAPATATLDAEAGTVTLDEAAVA